MNVKRIISLISLVTFLSTALLGVSAFAAEADSGLSQEKINLMIASGELIPGQTVTEENVKIKKDKAVEIAGTMLENASDFEANNVYLNPGYGSMKSNWSVNFYSKSIPAVNVYVSVDADTGEITGYNMWNNAYGQQNYVAKYTRAEALTYAEDFLKNRIKFNSGDYELQPEDPYAYAYSTGGVKNTFVYNFSYVRKINGILLPADTLYIGVDGTNGMVTSFNHNAAAVDMSKLPSATDVIPADKALEKYKQSVDFSLQYITQFQDSLYGMTPKLKVLLAYVPTYYTDYLDATKGVLINYDGSEFVAGSTGVPGSKPVPMNPDAVLPAGSAKTETEAGIIAETYKKKAEELLGVKFDDINMNQQVYGTMSDSWYFNWNKNLENTNYSLNITINKTTGRVNNAGFSKYDYSNEQMMGSGQKLSEVKENTTWSMGKEKALETVKKLAPEQYGFYMDQNLKEPVLNDEAKKTMREYNYYFTRVENGILFRDNTISVNIDRETGEVKNFYMNWNDVDFPQDNGVVTKEAAMATYYNNLEPKLQYFQKTTYDLSSQMPKTDSVPMLVYSFVRKGYAYGGGMYINAASGKLMDYSGNEVKPAVSAAGSQLGDSWAKRSVELLIAQGIIKNPYIDYDMELTRAEAVKMLSLAKGYQYYDYSQIKTQTFTDVPSDSEYFPYVENAVGQGIIAKGTEFRGDEKITKEEFAVLLINMTGYADLAGKSSIFKADGLNITNPANTGYIAICSGLDFLPVKPGETFNGSSKVTLAEAAAALYKALSYIR